MRGVDIGFCLLVYGFVSFALGYLGVEFTGDYFVGQMLGAGFIIFGSLFYEHYSSNRNNTSTEDKE